MAHVDSLMDNVYLAIVAVVIIPIVDGLAVAANVTGTTRTIVLLFAVFIALGALFAILSNFRASTKR